ncbi:MAG: polysaccharide pyruvyl transferase family protein [Lachnospiraceae bacterium]|nr:polysaccharide pyruvyl transferase family protein [Lachnospiraceae bacterium]
MEENRLLMYMHAGSGNHGCEAIVNSVCHMVKEKVTLLSYYGEEDEKYSLKDLCHIVSERRFEEHKLAHVLYYGYRKITGDQESFIHYRYGDVMKGKTAPLAISIGGDNYCYDNMLSDLRLANLAFNRKGVKTVLLGCSIEPELLRREDIVADLMRYHTIIARESITYEALKGMVNGQTGEIGGRKEMPQILCYPDPAFTLQKKEVPLPEGFAEGNTVGINVSPMIQDNEKESGITMECYEALIQYIIENTGFQIALIPHVVWARNDDRKPIHILYVKFKDTGRVVEIGDGTCEELKGYISRCRLFVGARTHATIAAYSSCVPTLVVGYSVKARGIARDLFGQEEHYVLPVQSLKHKDDLVKEFQWLLSREKEIREKLEKKMPDYRNLALETGKEVDRLWEEFTQQPRI